MTDAMPPRPVGPHPTAEQLYRARRGPRDAEAERVLLHAAGCALCSTEMARQDAFDAPPAVPAAAMEAAWERFGREPRIRRPAGRAAALSLAAALAVCVLGLGVWVAGRRSEMANVERGAPATVAAGGPSGTLNAPPAAFTFANPGGEPRRIRVFDAAQSYTWTSGPTTGGRIVFPETERRRLRPGVEYFWTLLDDPEGGAARSFRIRRREP
jgi:hypothetical protein